MFQLFKTLHKEMLIFSLGTWIFNSITMKMKLIHHGELKKIWDDNSNSLISVVKVNGKKIYLGGDLDNASWSRRQVWSLSLEKLI